jgi:hypothetical protein
VKNDPAIPKEIGRRAAPELQSVTVKLFFAATDLAQAERIVEKGFNAWDFTTVKLPYGNPTFVEQPGIIASTVLDPHTGFAVELEIRTNTTYLRRYELISHVPGVKYYVLMRGDTKRGGRRRVSESELAEARRANVEKWQNQPLVWFGKE